MQRLLMTTAITCLFLLTGCVSSSDNNEFEQALLEEVRQAATQYYAPGMTLEDRLNIMDDGYIQRNPNLRKFADERGISYKEGYEEYITGIMAEMAENPPPPESDLPPNEPLHIVIAEDDLVLIVRKEYDRDPNEAEGTIYESYVFNLFRIRDGKLYEHWSPGGIDPEE